jgi:uncharacterized 2Fe-2S/4Fe-4S cluster protein (DUF4445 family)
LNNLENRHHRIFIEPMGLSMEISEGETLLDCALIGKIPLRSDCGGKGSCGKCMVRIDAAEHLSPVTEAELELISSEELKSGYRLACQARILGPVSITIPREALDMGEDTSKTKIKTSFPLDPMVERLFLRGEELQEKSDTPPRSFVESVSARLREVSQRKLTFSSYEALNGLSQPFAYQGDMTLVNHSKRGVTAILEGLRRRSLGVALDVGTTTVAAYLCDLQKGEILSSTAGANPQRRFGEDVISRISFANEQDSGAQILHDLIIGEVNALINRCLEVSGNDRQDVDEVTVVGNTTMQQIFAGFHPHGLGFSPYLPLNNSPMDFFASEVGLDLNRGTNIHIFPVISGFVGGDTMGVILGEKPHEREGVTLIVDIGTNGEVVLARDSELWVTSCATGPALEGAHIDSGMRAMHGAIHKVTIDGETFKVAYEVLGENSPPRGICGSGIIDAVAGMVNAGLIMANGRIKEGLPGVRTDDKGIGRKFVLAPSLETATGKDISITLDDVRQIQLAKSALRVGIELLMRRSGVSHIDRMILTGAFGARFDWRNAVTINMLPGEETVDHVIVVENAAGTGAILALLDRGRREEARELSTRIRFIELAEDPEFAAEFPTAMAFHSAKV